MSHLPGNLIWWHIWPTCVVTRGWAGLAAEAGRFILGGPVYPAINHPFVFGADLFVSMSDRFALFGEANFITPIDSGTVTAFLGVASYPGGMQIVFRNRSAPADREQPVVRSRPPAVSSGHRQNQPGARATEGSKPSVARAPG